MSSEPFPTRIPVQLGDLTKHWDVTDQLFQWSQKLPLNAPGPDLVDRYIDEQQVAGHRVYIVASSHLDNAREHLDLLRKLLTELGPTPRVPWTLMRSVFESSFWANWVLEPTSSEDRRRRGLRLEIQGHKERTNFYNDYLRVHPVELDRKKAAHLRHEQVYRSEAERLGLTWPKATQKIDVVGEIGRLAVVKEMGSELESQVAATWRALSGAQHGHAYATMHLSDVVHGEKIIGGRTGTVTISDSMLQLIGSVTHTLLVSALGLFIRRSTQTTRRH